MVDSLSRFIRPMVARDRDEQHRSATSLELLFDLVIVIAIASAAKGLEHDIEGGHAGAGIVKYLMAFFCIWWPWNMFAWFASSFDNCDVAYRIKVMVIMIGAMLMAASMPGFFEHGEMVYIFIGFVIMRMAFTALWIRVWKDNPQHRVTAKRYAVGQVLVQGYWGIVVFAPAGGSLLQYGLFFLGVAFELFIPWFAHGAERTPWHKHHIIERFGLLNIIVLGEVLLGSAVTLKTAFSGHLHASLFMVALCGIITAFLLWWLYFAESDHLGDADIKRVFTWAYGHVFVFASGAAVGAGLTILGDYVVEAADHGGAVFAVGPAAAFSIPISLYLAGLWFVRDRFMLRDACGWVLIGFAILIGLSCFLPYPPISTVLLLIACLVVRLRSEKRVVAPTAGH
jgi:low temperature requirement protein LtrA